MAIHQKDLSDRAMHVLREECPGLSKQHLENLSSLEEHQGDQCDREEGAGVSWRERRPECCWSDCGLGLRQAVKGCI